MEKRIGLVVHGAEAAMQKAREVASVMDSFRAKLFAEDTAAQRLLLPALSSCDEPLHFVLSIGGDGTLLRGVQWALAWNVPLLGINMGRLGFLTEAEPDALEAYIPRLMCGDYRLEDRSLLHITNGSQEWTALNDAVITRGGYARLITMEVRVDAEWMGQFVADGLVVATPTGSTAYSLSAGGPVVAPGVDCNIITPICAHSLQHRPTLTAGNATIQLKMGADLQQRGVLQIDGRNCMELSSGDKITIQRFSQKLQLVRFQDLQFFYRVHSKLKEWTQ